VITNPAPKVFKTAFPAMAAEQWLFAANGENA
jgi:hypothetical protein